jgi:site-specific recombinase XerD
VRSQYREIFLLPRAPWTPITYGSISNMVSRCIRLAGVDPPGHHGAHVLRHSFATRLFNDGISLKEIGDLLGHQHPDSTHIYTKSATERLQEVALEVPEVSSCRKL